jgi:hypothetical protein
MKREEHMKAWVVGLMIAGSAMSSAHVEAQLVRPVERLQIAPYAGYMVFGNLLDGPLGTSLRTADAPMFGAQLGLTLMPNVALVGNVAHSSTSIEAGVPLLGGVELAKSKVLMYDAGLQIALAGAGARTTPFVQLGAGAMRHTVTVGPVSTNATNPAVTGGIGVDVQMGRNVAMRLMAKDYYGKFDFEEAALIDVGGDKTHNFALTAGIKFGF